MAIYSDEDFDQDLQQDIAAAAAQSAGVNMDSYDFGGFDSGGSDFTGASNQGVVDSIVGSYMDNPSRTGMAIRQSFPMFNSPESGLNKFANLYTAQRGPLSREDFNSMYDISRTNPGGINTYGYDTAKNLQRMGLGSGRIETNPNVGRLTGQVYSRKNDKGETILMEGGKSAGIDADTFYSGKSSSDLDGGDLFDTYYDKYQYADPATRAEARRYDQYMNPYNKLGSMLDPTGPAQPGFNPDIDPNFNPQAFDLRGQVRPGLQSGIFGRKDGTPTQFGPIATYDRDYSGLDNIKMTLTPGGIGMIARALTNKVTGIADQPLPQDAMAPTPEMIARGETYSGLSRSFGQIPGQIKQGLTNAGAGIRNVIDDFTTPNLPAPAPVNTVPQTRESIIDELYSRNFAAAPTIDLPVAQPESKPVTLENAGIPSSVVEKPLFSDYLEANPLNAAEMNARAREKEAVKSELMKQGNSSLRAELMAREQVYGKSLRTPDVSGVSTGSPDFRDTLPDLEGSLRPEDLSSFLPPIGDNRLAADVTGMTDFGGGRYRVEPSAYEKALEAMGLRKRKPQSSQIYSPSKEPNMFQDLVNYFS